MTFSKTLIQWYLENKRALPWRSTKDPYFIWLSEIILQQTRIEQGKPYYLKFVERFPDVEQLANASEEEVLKLWQGLGYYSRARNLHTTAKHVAFDLDTVFPSSYKGLLKLKGVGEYTASAIASICYDEPVAVVDGNVYRVLSRIFGIDTPIDSTAGRKEFSKLALELLDTKNPSDFNQGLMEFGALQCKPQLPECATCPFSTECVAFNQGKISELPVKAGKQKIKQRHFNYIVLISDEKKTLLKQRKDKGIWQGLYEFPLVETSAEATVENLVAEESFVSYAAGADPVLYNEKPIVHKLSHQHIFTKFWIISCSYLPAEAVQIEEIDKYPVPVLIEKFIDSYSF